MATARTLSSGVSLAEVEAALGIRIGVNYITYALTEVGERDLAAEIAQAARLADGSADPYVLALAAGTLANVDPRAPRTEAAMKRLVASYDVLFDQFRPGVLARLGLGHDALRAQNPRLVVCALTGYGFSIRTNNVKLSCSQLVVDIVNRALLICGLQGYRNDSKYSLSRHLRDAYGAALMVNNDRITKHNATMLLVHKEG